MRSYSDKKQQLKKMVRLFIVLFQVQRLNVINCYLETRITLLIIGYYRRPKLLKRNIIITKSLYLD